MKKKISTLFLAILIIVPFHIGSADLITSDDATADDHIETSIYGEVDAKDEVIYGNISATGMLNDLYVVNMLHVTQPGIIIDQGDYTSVRNLTNLTDIENGNGTVQLQASPGWFYYQGMMQNREVPWHFDMTYSLDGENIAPQDLAGKEGQLLITIKTSENENADPIFYENYALQISLTFDTANIRNIQAPDTTIANVGKKKQITYTVMHDTDGDLSLLADVVDFEMEGIEISAIPLSMAIDDPDIADMTKDMRTLSDAIDDITEGISDLLGGITELNDGMHTLNDGSSEYESGMTDMSHSSSDIITSSEKIEASLAELAEELSGTSDDMDMGELEQLPEGLSLLAEGLDELADGLTLLQENFAMANSALDDAMQDIPAPAVTDNDIQQLYTTGADHDTLDHIVEVYNAAQMAKGTYDNVKDAFAAVETTLADISEGVHDISQQLTTMAGELSVSLEDMEALEAISELEDGITLLALNYSEFHAGLTSYADGITELADAYSEIDSGLGEVADGTSELESGTSELYEGTQELAESTHDLPEQLEEQVNEMMAEFDKSDFEAVSFVSQENTNMKSVQFILRTDPIEMEDEEEFNTNTEEEKAGFWQRLKDLFS